MIQRIGDLQGDYTLITDSQDVKPLNDDTGQDYDGYLVKVGDGELTEAWGFYGIVPRLEKRVYRVL